MECQGLFTFGDGFKLEVGRDERGRKVLTLFQNNQALLDVMEPTLELLHYMVQRPRKELADTAIVQALWPTSTSRDNIVEKHVSFLRSWLKDESKHPRYIRTIHGRGYQFMLDVQVEYSSVEAHPKWDRALFYALMRDVKRGPESDSEDLRIVATGIGASLDELDLKGLLRRGVRIKILFINPENKALTDGRYALRKDKPPSRCVRELKDQIADIRSYAQQYPRAKTENGGEKVERGILEFGVSDIMPCGFVVHTREWAVLGIYLAHDSFIAAPMIYMRKTTEPWEALHCDWQARWHEFEAKLSGQEKASRLS